MPMITLIKNLLMVFPFRREPVAWQSRQEQTTHPGSPLKVSFRECACEAHEKAPHERGLMVLQGSVCPLTCISPYSGFVSNFCQSLRAFVSASVQLGEHSGTRGCCTASGGSAGIAGGATLLQLAGVIGDLLAQAVSVSTSVSSISLSAGELLRCLRGGFGNTILSLLFGLSVFSLQVSYRLYVSSIAGSPFFLPGVISGCNTRDISPVTKGP
nr:MAG TPA: hypothetical protein [Caudoviricetes sp.]